MVLESIDRAKSNGAPVWYVNKLRELCMKRYRSVFRVQLGKEGPALMTPAVLRFDESKWKHVARPRVYNREQMLFLRKTIKKLSEADLIEKSNTRFAAPPYCPMKKPLPGSTKVRY